ncbi:hypothetical protein E2C01_067153 [Portunus trituberculatus]|uniref:Uncharacterized protein n=1 Tax=Portunus trituberculatus TaxID=210409 RepID=A0A5B7HSU6_PORTR|nr:hypothetical protein [Portunus trituberculatus]
MLMAALPPSRRKGCAATQTRSSSARRPRAERGEAGMGGRGGAVSLHRLFPWHDGTSRAGLTLPKRCPLPPGTLPPLFSPLESSIFPRNA